MKLKGRELWKTLGSLKKQIRDGRSAYATYSGNGIRDPYCIFMFDLLEWKARPRAEYFKLINSRGYRLLIYQLKKVGIEKLKARQYDINNQ